MASNLVLMDEVTGKVYLALDAMGVSCLVMELFYTIDYKDFEYPDYVQLRDALNEWQGDQ